MAAKDRRYLRVENYSCYILDYFETTSIATDRTKQTGWAVIYIFIAS